ncbi:SusD/RagB family nutrient-binding outer membrane lipoprotein [Cellulophaga baltica]|uniref:SusD/RagB family nutrient-binding outer membrane lipoprotein n=1 Tax=Cellulophaga TaxID=104264 RepID=UPI001C07D934|nr:MULTISPECIES: SusD/RagB family nutrient-binding outer membrane lipoprotein [Cellulophaga]MBU2995958.1 SusD/RagB family nutrient-binding outer membrane lipoprotein [Cellulophaga baltica]MDO6767353.1 SusD/RagB family nutrient-binding outer membrane lipoprotein [Cellulophaga sp. 1_MG-2023]
MKNYIKIYLSIIIASTVFTACSENFDEINENNNNPESVSPQFLLTNVISVSSDLNAYEQGFRQSNYLAQFSASIEFERIDRYEMGSNSEYWNSIFQLQSDILSIKASTTTNEAYNAVGNIMQSYLFSQLTDLWGDVPYTEALGALDGNFLPKYDTQESIYTDTETGIIAVLENAVTVLENTNTTIKGDVLFSGDLTKWVKFANSLQVRYLIRISKRLTDFSALQTLADSGNLMQSNEDNAVLPYLSSTPNQFPLFTASSGTYNEHRMTATVDSILKSWDDPRMMTLYNPTGSTTNSDTPEYHGLINGQSTNTISSSGVDLNNISLFGSIFRDVADGVDAQFMQYSEVQFALAEAVTKGYISGDANTYYQNAITASFEYYNTEIPAEYFTKPEIVLDGSEDDITKILTQKWLSLISVGHEAWFNVRRTGIPYLKPGPDNLNEDRYPVRYLYPESEQASNNANYQEASDRIGGDDINSKGWWEKD